MTTTPLYDRFCILLDDVGTHLSEDAEEQRQRGNDSTAAGREAQAFVLKELMQVLKRLDHYSLDADEAGIRAKAAFAISGAMSFGAQNTSPPPDGHWLGEFWSMARAERAMFETALASPAPSAAEPVALTDAMIHDLSSYWVHIRSGRESEQYEELRQFARAIEATLQGRDALELDTSDCDDCCGKGWNWEKRQVGERESDVQEFKIECESCEGRGYVGPDADRRAALAAFPSAPVEAQAVPEGEVVPFDVWQERVACARVADAFAHESGPGPGRFAGNVISARILGRTKGRVVAPTPSKGEAP